MSRENPTETTFYALRSKLDGLQNAPLGQFSQGMALIRADVAYLEIQVAALTDILRATEKGLDTAKAEIKGVNDALETYKQDFQDAGDSLGVLIEDLEGVRIAEWPNMLEKLRKFEREMRGYAAQEEVARP